MKKLKLIYNPFSGDKSFKYNLDPVINVFQKGGYETHVFRSMEDGDIDRHLREISEQNKEYYDTIVVSGGDGSINIILNAMIKYGISTKLGIIPSGTANDFATFLRIPPEHDKAAEIITNGITIKSDIGEVNGRYFINVCGAGHFTNISQNIDYDFKNTLGKLAYYIKGIEQAPNLVPMRVKITNSVTTYDESIYFFIVLNSAGTGGFNNLVRDASLNDGMFEFISVREGQFKDLAALLFNLLKGDHLLDPGVLYFKDSYIKIEPADDLINEELLETDLDGERGPSLPVEIKNIPEAVTIFAPDA